MISKSKNKVKLGLNVEFCRTLFVDKIKKHSIIITKCIICNIYLKLCKIYVIIYITKLSIIHIFV